MNDILKIKINDDIVSLTEQQVSRLIKNFLKANFVVQKVFKQFNLDINNIDKLQILITDLEDDRYAETDDKTLKMNKSLFNGEEFSEIFAVVFHEIWHFAKRLYEKSGSYFADSEELEAFSISIAAQISNGDSIDVIYNRIFPKIEFHYHDEQKALKVFKDLVEKAQDFLSSS